MSLFFTRSRENCQSQAFREAASRLLFDHMDLQVIKIDLLDEAVPCEPGLIVELKVFYIGIQPDGLPQVKFAADLIQSLKDHGSAGHGVVPVGGHGIQEQMIVLPELSPHTEHKRSPFYVGQE